MPGVGVVGVHIGLDLYLMIGGVIHSVLLCACVPIEGGNTKADSSEQKGEGG